MRKITKRSLAIGIATAVAVGGGAAAWAAWTVTGHATASASTGSASAVQVSGAVLDGPLIPQHKVGVAFNIYNPNNFKVHVTAASLGAITSSNSACNSNDTYAVLPSAAIPVFDIEAGQTATTTLPQAIQLKNTVDDHCQGAPIQFEVTVTAASADA